MNHFTLLKNILINKQNINYNKNDNINDEVIFNDFINNSVDYSTLSIIAFHQYFTKYYKEDYHQKVIKAIFLCDFDDCNINLVIILKNIFVESSGISFQENVEDFINVIIKLGKIICDLLFNKHTFDKKKQVLCFEILDLFNHICDEASMNITLDLRFIQMISEIFTHFSSNKYVLNNARYNIHVIIKLLKKCHDVLNFHDNCLYSQILVTLLFGLQDINNAHVALLNENNSSFMKSLTEKCKHLEDEDESRKWLAILREVILVYFDWFCELVQDFNKTSVVSNSLSILAESVLFLNEAESITKGFIALFVTDDGKLMKLLAYCLLIEEDFKGGNFLLKSLDLVTELLESVFYDVTLICQWLKEYDDFRDVFCHFITDLEQKKVEHGDELVRFLKELKLSWKEYSQVEDELQTTLDLFLR